MASNILLSLLIITFLFSSFLYQCPSDINPSTPTSACNSTPYPYFCRSILPSNGSSNLYNYGRFSVGRSLSIARRFLALIDGHLKQHSSLTETAIWALEDCQLLSELNIDFLSSALATLNSTKSLLSLESSPPLLPTNRPV